MKTLYNIKNSFNYQIYIQLTNRKQDAGRTEHNKIPEQIEVYKEEEVKTI
jgi:hypothetical protein